MQRGVFHGGELVGRKTMWHRIAQSMTVLLSSLMVFLMHSRIAYSGDAGVSFHVVAPDGGLTFYAGTLNYVTVRITNRRVRPFLADDSEFDAVLHVPEQAAREPSRSRRWLLPLSGTPGYPRGQIAIPAKGMIELPVLVTSQVRAEMALGLGIAVSFSAHDRLELSSQAHGQHWGFLEFVPVTLAEATPTQREQDFIRWRRSLRSDKGLNRWAVGAAPLINTEETAQIVHSEYLRASDSMDRGSCALALARMELPLAGRLALDCLRDPDEITRCRVMDWLGSNHPSLVAEAAQGALRDPSQYVRSAAIRALAQTEAACDLLLGVLATSDDADVRKEAAGALDGRCDAEVVAGRVLTALRSERDPEVRSQLLSAHGLATKYTGVPPTRAVASKQGTAGFMWLVYGGIGFLAGALGVGLVLLIRRFRRPPGNRSQGIPGPQVVGILLWIALTAAPHVLEGAEANRASGVSLSFHVPQGAEDGLYLDGVANYIDVELTNGTEQEILAELWVNTTRPWIYETLKEPTLTQCALRPGRKAVVTALRDPSPQRLKEGPTVFLSDFAVVGWRNASEDQATAPRRLASLSQHVRWSRRTATSEEHFRAVEALRAAAPRARGRGATGIGEYMQVLRAAGLITHKSALTLLREQYQVNATDEPMRLLCVRSIVRCSQGLGVEVLEPYLKDPSAEVRRELLTALADQEDPRLSDICRLALQDSDASVRTIAATDVNIGSDRGASVLQAIATSDPDPGVRACTISALVRSGHLPPESVLMRMASSDPHPVVRRSAAGALERCAHPPSRADFLRLLKAEPDEETRGVLWQLAGEEVLRLAPGPLGQLHPQPQTKRSARWFTWLAEGIAAPVLGAIAGGLLTVLMYRLLTKPRRAARG